jgi:Ca2+-binding RTX toxin-like protein
MFESLEERQLFAISVSPDGVVTVIGTGGKDTVNVFGNKSSATITAGADFQQVTNLKRIIIKGKGGDDILTCANLNGTAGNVPVKIVGGAGDDVIHGATGGDTLIGGDGADELHGLDGKDTIKGGTGKDTIAGGPGKDDISSGPGKDNVTKYAQRASDDSLLTSLEILMAE